MASPIQFSDLTETKNRTANGRDDILLAYDAIGQIVRSEMGQQKLARLEQLQRLIPKDMVWEPALTDADRNTPEKAQARDSVLRAIGPRDPRKMALVIHTDTNDKDVGLLGDPTASAATATYLHPFHAMVIGLPRATLKQAVMRNEAGKLVISTIPLDAILMHELEHTIGFLEERFEGKPPTSHACREQRAVDTERAYTQERNKTLPAGQKLPYRETYINADFNLKTKLDLTPGKRYGLMKMLGIPHEWRGGVYPMPESAVATLVGEYAPTLQLEAGCNALSEDTLLQRTRALLNGNGVDTKPYPDAKLKQWIKDGREAAIKQGLIKPALER